MARSQLDRAIISDDMTELKRLVESGEDLGRQNHIGWTPLMRAIAEGHEPISEYLVNVMSVKSLSKTDDQRNNVLHIIASKGRPWLSVWTASCAKCPGLAQQRNVENKTPLDTVKEKRFWGYSYRKLFNLLYTKKMQTSLTDKKIHTYNITIACIGHEGVGKTCLVTNLKEEKVPKGGPPSTNLGNLHINHMDFDPDTHKRQHLKKGGDVEIGRQRLCQVVNESEQQAVIPTDNLPTVQEEAMPTPDEPSNEPVDSSSYASEQSELKEYKLFKGWLKECQQSFDKWLKDTTEKNTTEDDKRLMRKFLVQYSSVIAKDIECTACSTTLCTDKPWYRCVHCTNVNICESCYKSGASLNSDHKDHHNLICVQVKCDYCKGYILGLKVHGTEVGSPSLCLGCYHYIYSDACERNDPPSYCPGKQIPYDQFENKVAEVMATAEEKEAGKRGFISIYDFGGEKVFYNTHHCLLSSDMVFLLVFDVPMCLDPKREKAGFDRIEFWMGSVTTYTTEKPGRTAADQEEKRGPPIILIGSHLDQVPGTEEEKLKKFRTAINKLKENPKTKPIMKRHVHSIYPVSNMNDSTKNRQLYNKIWNKIMEVAPLQSQWRKLIPARWLDLEFELMTKKAKGCNIMTFEELKKLNETLIVPLEDDADLKEFLQHVQLTGSMLVCCLHRSSPYIILNFEVITRAFRSFITAPKFKTELNIRDTLNWKNYEKSGILPVKFLRTLLKEEKVQELTENEDLVLFTMEENGLLCKPLVDQNKDVDYYIVPSMLEQARPNEICDVLVKPSVVKTSALCLRFEQEFTPPAVWDKLLASCIQRSKPFEVPGEGNSLYIQRGFACLCFDRRWKVIMNCKGNEMKLVLFKDGKDKTKPPAGIGNSIRIIIEYFLEQILEMCHQDHLKYKYFLHCDHRFTEGDEMVKADEFLKDSSLSWTCHGPEGKYTLQREDYDIWFNEPEQKVTDYDLPKALQHKIPLPKELGRICEFLGKPYHEFFVELGCEMALIERTIEEFDRHSLRSQLTRLFIRQCSQRRDINYSHISLAMKNHGIDSAKLPNVVDNRQQETQIKDTKLSEAVLNRKPTDTELKRIGKYINKSYFIVFLELGLPVEEIERSEMDHKTMSKRIEDLLRKWIKTCKTSRTINHLLLAMKECHEQWYDLSSDLSSVMKDDRCVQS